MDRYSVCQAVLRSGDLATDVRWAAESGAMGIGLEAEAVRSAGTEAALELLAGHNLRCSSIIGAFDPILELPVATAASDTEAVMSLYADLAPVGIVLTTGPLDGRSIHAADRGCAGWLAAAAPVAAEAGVPLLLEPVHPLLRHISYVHTLRHAADLTADQPGTGLVADTGHLWWDRSLTDDISALASRVGSVQLDDVDADALTRYEYRRTQLGQGVIPLTEIVAALEASGYGGFYENEIIARVPRGDRVDFARRGGEQLAAWLEQG